MRIFDRELKAYRELSQKETDELIASKSFEVIPPDGVVRYSKARLFANMTDAEYATFEQIQSQQKKREQKLFDAALEISPELSQEMFTKFVSLVLGAYGPERGQQLLDQAKIS